MPTTSAQDVVRFTPSSYNGEDGAPKSGSPVYLLAPLTWRERSRFRAALATEGIRFPQDSEIAAAVLAVVAEAAPSNADDLTSKVEAFQALLVDGPPPTKPADGATADDVAAYQAEVDRRTAIAMAYDVVLDTVRQAPAVGRLIGLRVLYTEMAPPIAASYALRGWENVPTKFSRTNGVVPDDVLAGCRDLAAVGAQAIVMMAVSQVQRGN